MRLQKDYKYIIFDFDGTINNTSPGIYATFTAVLNHFGIDASKIDLSRHIGPPLSDSYTHLVGSEKCEEAIKLHKQVYADNKALYNSFLYDGIVEVLDQLYDSGKFTLAIASSKYEPHAYESLAYHKIDKYFRFVYGQTDKRGFKEEVLRQLIDDNGFERDECLMIGDTLHDVEGAHANGIDVVAVTYGFGKVEELKNSHPISICDSPREILSLLL